MRLLGICLLALLTGCATSRTVTIMTKPPGATVEVDGGVYRKKAPFSYTFTWESDTDSHRVEAMLPGYQNEPRAIPRDYDRDTLLLELRPQQMTLTILVTPADASVSINNDKPLPAVANGSYVVRDLPFTQNQQNGKYTEYRITAERKGFKTAVRTASYSDREATYTIELQPMDKELSITTSPPGAEIFFDDESIGTTASDGLKATRTFSYDVTKEKFDNHKLTAKLAGYPERSIDIGWDDGKGDYHLDFSAYSKTVKIQTIPPGGQVILEGRQMKTESSGETLAYLEFPPVNGKQRTYTGVISKPDFKDFPITLAWDNGKTDYTFRLVPVPTLKMQLTKVAITSDGTSWKVAAGTETTIAGKDPAEHSGQELQQLTPAEAKGQNIDSIAISPDGKRLLYTVLIDKPDFHSLMYMMPTDGSTAPVLLNDGKSLDITPSFSPDGEQILFASDRAGKLIIWAMSAIGGRRTEQYTTGLTTDWWPSMDSSPKARVFYEARSDRLAKPTIYSRPIDLNSLTDLGADGGMKPRINATNDTVVYEAYNDMTQKRDLWRISDRGASPANLTNSPDADDCDASWDRLGSKIAFASDRGVDDDEKRHNYDIWVLDLTEPNAQPQRVTSNVSQDDRPVWDPSGHAIYFRSNRGGEWGIWKISLK
jgi:Tol biopolymer transport system component